jgi:hypothetical protein
VSKVLGHLIQDQIELLGEGTRKQDAKLTIQALRARRLRDSLEGAGTSVSARTASILSDGLATGQFAVTATNVAMRNNAGGGIDIDCSCKPPILAPFLACSIEILVGNVSCVTPPDSACPNCAMTIGVNVSGIGSMAIAGKADELGRGALKAMPVGVAEAARTISKLVFPIEDRLRLREQLRMLEIGPTRALANLSFPLMSEADALVKLFDRSEGNLLQLAVGDYDRSLSRDLASGLAAGSIQVNEGEGTIQVLARPAGSTGVTAKLECLCVQDDEAGGCNYVFDPGPPGKVSCNSSGCDLCEPKVTIGRSALAGLFMA